jgi:nitric oxide reductase NorE protein
MTLAMREPQGASSATRHFPGEVGIWVFIAGDLIVFGLFFVTYLYYQGREAALFAEAQRALSQGIGILNTVLLLTSSWFVAGAVQQVRRGDRALAALLVGFGFLCGAAFLLDKAIEWSQLIGDHKTLMTNNFYMFFFMFTGIHAMHVLVGMGVLAYLRSRIRAGIGRDDPARHDADLVAIESGAIFWHLVDLLWLVLFALLYLVRL